MKLKLINITRNPLKLFTINPLIYAFIIFYLVCRTGFVKLNKDIVGGVKL